MNHAIFDSNILIDYLSGNLDALSVIDACAYPAISKIAYMEVMVGCKHSAMVRMATPDNYDDALLSAEKFTRLWISNTFVILPIDDPTAELAIEVRKQTRSRLPDSVTHATALLNGWDIVTRDPKDFASLAQLPSGYKNIGVIVPYTLQS